MVQVAADAAHVRDGTSGLIPPEWHGCLPVRAKRDAVSTFAAIGGYYEAMGAVKNEADLLAWSLKSDGVDGDPT